MRNFVSGTGTTTLYGAARDLTGVLNGGRTVLYQFLPGSTRGAAGVLTLIFSRGACAYNNNVLFLANGNTAGNVNYNYALSIYNSVTNTATVEQTTQVADSFGTIVGACVRDGTTALAYLKVGNSYRYLRYDMETATLVENVTNTYTLPEGPVTWVSGTTWVGFEEDNTTVYRSTDDGHTWLAVGNTNLPTATFNAGGYAYSWFFYCPAGNYYVLFSPSAQGGNLQAIYTSSDLLNWTLRADNVGVPLGGAQAPSGSLCMATETKFFFNSGRDPAKWEVAYNPTDTREYGPPAYFAPADAYIVGASTGQGSYLAVTTNPANRLVD
jgi:hypothetical protein